MHTGTPLRAGGVPRGHQPDTDELMARWRHHHDTEARDLLFARYLPLARIVSAV